MGVLIVVLLGAVVYTLFSGGGLITTGPKCDGVIVNEVGCSP